MSNRAKLFLPIGFFFLMVGLLFYGLKQDPSKVPSALLSRPLPAFNLPSLLPGSGPVTDEALKGQITLINFWGTWCPPCHAEHPYLVEISEREKDIVFVGINHKESDDGETAREFLQERGNPFKYVAFDKPNKLGIDFGVTGAPETFLVDKAGTIRYKHIGAIDNKVWEEIFVPLLKELR